MGHQSTFYFEWADAVTRALDYIVGTAYEPIVTILVTPSHIACIVHIVVPSIFCTFFVAIVALEQANRLTVVGTDYNLSLFTVFGRTAIGSEQVDFVLRIRHTHATWFRFHPWESTQRHGCFGLAKAFHEADAGNLQECFVYRIVERFARSSTIFQRRKVVLADVFLNQETEDGRRRTEGCDLAILNLLKDICRSELLVVVHEDVRTRNHLTIQLTPSCLSPTGIGNGKVQAVFMQLVPERAGSDVTQRISKVVSNHLRFASCSTGEVHQHDIVVDIRVFRLHERSCIGNTLLEILETFRHTWADAYHMLQGWAIRHRFDNVVGDYLFASADNHLDIGCIATIHDVFLGQQVSGRNHDRTQLMQGDSREPEFDTALQDKHDHIAMANAQALEIRSSSIGLFLQFCISILMFQSLVVSPEDCILFRTFGSPCIHYIIAEVEVFRNLNLEVLYKFLLRGIFSLFYISF